MERVHLFPGVMPSAGILPALENLAGSGDSDIEGNLCGREAFKTARSAVNLIAVSSVERLEQALAAVEGDYATRNTEHVIVVGMKTARFLLTIDRHRGWLPHLTLERFAHTVRRLNSVCSDNRAVITIGRELLADLKSWLSAKPAKAVSQKEPHA